MALPKFVTIATSPAAESQLHEPFRFKMQPGTAPAAGIITTSGGDSFAKTQDLLLWSDVTWKFTVGAEGGPVDDNYFAFGSDADVNVASVLHMADGVDSARFIVDQFRVASNPYNTAMAKMYPAVPFWWTERGAFLARNADDTVHFVFQTEGTADVPIPDIAISAENGFHVSAARNDGVIRFEFQTVAIMKVEAAAISLTAHFIADNLLSPKFGIKIRERTSAPDAGDGEIGQLVAVWIDPNLWLYVKVAAGVWKKTAAFSAAPP